MAPEGGGRKAGLASVVEGLTFLLTRKVLLLTFVVDIIAMVFGMPRALFAPMADQVFHAGAATAGAMYSALAAGALLGALFGGWFGRIHRQGLAVVVAIVGWGVCILLFGLTSNLWLALALLAGAGAADMVSAVFRTAILQTAAPDAMRGRLGGVFIVVVAGGPRLGDARSGAFGVAVRPAGGGRDGRRRRDRADAVRRGPGAALRRLRRPRPPPLTFPRERPRPPFRRTGLCLP